MNTDEFTIYERDYNSIEMLTFKLDGFNKQGRILIKYKIEGDTAEENKDYRTDYNGSFVLFILKQILMNFTYQFI